jgi:IS5 family transposase
LSVRMVIGSLIIKERLGTSDEETVEQIRENPYLQYFLGFKQYTDEAPFHPSMFVHFRKRIGKKTLGSLNEAIRKKAVAEINKQSDDKSNDDKSDGGGASA